MPQADFPVEVFALGKVYMHAKSGQSAGLIQAHQFRSFMFTNCMPLDRSVRGTCAHSAVSWIFVGLGVGCFFFLSVHDALWHFFFHFIFILSSFFPFFCFVLFLCVCVHMMHCDNILFFVCQNVCT